MPEALPQSVRAHRYDVNQQKEKVKRINAQAAALRAVEVGVASVDSLLLGALEQWKPGYQTIGGFVPVPEVVSMVLGAIGYGVSKEKQHVVKEISAGLFLAGEIPIMRKLGAWGMSKISG